MSEEVTEVATALWRASIDDPLADAKGYPGAIEYWEPFARRAIEAMMLGWQPISTAPKDGTQFLAALSNGWVTILSEVPNWDRYAWYRTSSGFPSIPVARTHTPESLSESLLATHWMPLPAPPA